MNLNDISYDMGSGTLVWRTTKGRAIKGEKVGWLSKHGYIEAQVQGKRFKAHHLVWYIHHGYFPKQLDHIDGDRTNNKIENLRECTTVENARNRKKKNNRALPRNVYHAKTKGKYRVYLTIEGKQISFGTFSDLRLADSVAKQARELYYGAFAGNG